MIERFQASLFQMGFGISSTSLGQVLTMKHISDMWTHIGRVANIIGLLASTISVINGIILLHKNAKKSKTIIAMKRKIAEWVIRWKRKTPKFFKGVSNFLLSIGIAAGAVLVAMPQFDIDLPIVKTACGYAVVICVFGVALANSTVENPQAITRYLDKLYSTKR